MTIRNSAYETTACQGFVVNKVQHAVEDALSQNNISSSKNNWEVKEVNHTYSTTPVPAFFHPIIVESKDTSVVREGQAHHIHNENKIVVVDVRSVGKFDELTGSFKIRSPYEYDFIVAYGELVNFWLKDNVRLLASVSHLPVALYARWISENIARRFGLNPQDQLNISILAAYFYLGQFTDDVKPDDRELQRLCGLIGKSVFVNAEMILNVIGDMPYISTLADLCTSIKELTGNVRLNDLNVGVIYAMLGNTWYGTNAKEMVAVALEYPPAWILLTYTSYIDRSYKNTGIAKMSVRDKKPEVDSFTKSLVSLLRPSLGK